MRKAWTLFKRKTSSLFLSESAERLVVLSFLSFFFPEPYSSKPGQLMAIPGPCQSCQYLRKEVNFRVTDWLGPTLVFGKFSVGLGLRLGKINSFDSGFRI